MKVSFIVPAYNEEKLLSRCLDSIIDEANRCDWVEEYEVIVVDNASTDGTADVVAQYPFVKRAVCPRKGLTRARETGFYWASYDVQAYIDADNYLPRGWMDNLAVLDEATGVVAITGPVYYFEQSWWVRWAARGFYALTMLCHSLIGPSMQGGNFVIRKRALELAGGHSTDIDFYGEDTDIAVRLSKFGEIRLLPSMWIYSSDRRLAHYGVVRAVWAYTLNYFSVILRGKPCTKEYKDIR